MWEKDFLREGDRVFLYGHDPTENPTEYLESVPNDVICAGDSYVFQRDVSLEQIRNTTT